MKDCTIKAHEIASKSALGIFDNVFTLKSTKQHLELKLTGS